MAILRSAHRLGRQLSLNAEVLASVSEEAEAARLAHRIDDLSQRVVALLEELEATLRLVAPAVFNAPAELLDPMTGRWTVGGITIDVDGRDVWICGERVHLQKADFDLLRVLVANPNRFISAEELQRAAWNSGPINGNAFYAHLGRVRRALGNERQRLKSSRNVGYKLAG